jgi:hypothetical protein
MSPKIASSGFSRALGQRLLVYFAAICLALGAMVVVLFVKVRYSGYHGPHDKTWSRIALADPNRTLYFVGADVRGIYINRYPVGARTTEEHLLPFWLLLGAAAALQPWWVTYYSRRWRRSRRLKAGLCVRCGYDLRATPGQCPECGSENAAEIGAVDRRSKGAGRQTGKGGDS